MKVIYFVPAIFFTLIFGTLAMSIGILAFSPFILLWLVLFWISGILLSKSRYRGGFLGAIPGIHWIYLGTKDTGQVINETPLGIFILVFYMLCCIYVYIKQKKKLMLEKHTK